MKNVLTSKSFVIIVSHKGPDGDSIGSSVALSRYLRKLKVNNIIVFPDSFPSYYDWLLDGEDFLIASNNLHKLSYLFAQSDLIFCLDLKSYTFYLYQ